VREINAKRACSSAASKLPADSSKFSKLDAAYSAPVFAPPVRHRDLSSTSSSLLIKRPSVFIMVGI
jgi:hypothetical protein